MDQATVFTKTAKGITQVNQRSASLSKDLMKVLKMIDGKSNFGQIMEKSELDKNQLEKALNTLTKDGFARVFQVVREELDFGDFTAPAGGGAAPRAPAASVDDDFDFTAKPSGTTQRVVPGAANDISMLAAQHEKQEVERKQKEAAHLAASARAKAEAQVRAKLDAEAKARKEAERQAMEQAQRAKEASERARAEVESQIREEEARKKVMLAQQAKLTAEQKIKEEAESRRLAELRVKAEREAKALAEARQRAEAEAAAMATARAAADLAAKKQAEEAVSAQAEMRKRLKEEIEARIRNEMEDLLRNEVEEKTRESMKAEILAEAKMAAQAELEERLRDEREHIAKAEAEARSSAELEATARADEESKKRVEAEARAMAETEARIRAEEETKKLRAQMEAESKRSAEMAAKAKQEAEQMAAKARQEALEMAAKAKQEAAELAAKAKQEAAELAAKARQEASEAAAKAAARAKMEGEEEAKRLRAQVEAETKRAAEAGARAKLEAEARARESADVEKRLDAERQAKYEAEARAKIDAEESEKRQREMAMEIEVERKAKQEAEARAKVEARARETMEVDTRAKVQAEIEGDLTKKAEIEGKAQARAYMEAKVKAEQDEEQKIRDDQARRAREMAEILRSKADAEEDKVETAAKPRKGRRRGGLVKTAIFLLLLLVVGGIGALHVIPLRAYTAKVERTLGEWLQDDVSIASMTFRLVPTPHLRLENVAVGKSFDAKAALGRVDLDLFSLFGEKPNITSIELSNVTLNQEAVRRIPRWGSAQGKAEGAGSISRITLTAVQMTTRPPLDAFNAVLNFQKDGTLKQAQLNSSGGWTLGLRPAEKGFEFDASARNMNLPLGAPIPISDATLKGTIVGNEIVVPEFQIIALDGKVNGTLKLSWGNVVKLETELALDKVAAAQLVGAFTKAISVVGRLDGNFTFVTEGPTVEALFANPRAQGKFKLGEGNISNIDLVAVMQSESAGSRAGVTKFAELTGEMSAAEHRASFKNVTLQGGVLKGNGGVEIGSNSALNGRLVLEIRSQVAADRGAFTVSGTVQRPILKRGG